MNLVFADKGLAEIDISKMVNTREEFAALTVVKLLNLSGNRLTKVAGLQPLSSVTHVNISRNKLVSLRGLPLSIVHLDVSHNELVNIEALSVMSCLQVLDISHNKISSLVGINRQAPLRTVKASFNLISSLQPVKAINLSTLRSFSVDGNYIEDPKELRMLSLFSGLVTLHLSANPFTQRYPNYQASVVAAVPSLQFLDGVSVKQHHEGDGSRLLGGKQVKIDPVASISETPPRRRENKPPNTTAPPQPTAFRSALEESRLRELLEATKKLPPPRVDGGSRRVVRDTHTGGGVEVGHQTAQTATAQSFHEGHSVEEAFEMIKVNKERRLEIRVGELQRVLAEAQEKCAVLEGKYERKVEELSGASQIVAEQRKVMAELREENKRLKDDNVGLREKVGKVGREFRYSRQANTNLKEKLDVLNTELLSPRGDIERAAAILSVPPPPSRRGNNTPTRRGEHRQTTPAGRRRVHPPTSNSFIHPAPKIVATTATRRSHSHDAVQQLNFSTVDSLHEPRRSSTPREREPQNTKMLSHISPPKPPRGQHY